MRSICGSHLQTSYFREFFDGEEVHDDHCQWHLILDITKRNHLHKNKKQSRWARPPPHENKKVKINGRFMTVEEFSSVQEMIQESSGLIPELSAKVADYASQIIRKNSSLDVLTSTVCCSQWDVATVTDIQQDLLKLQYSEWAGLQF